MSKYVKISADRLELVDKLLQLTEEERKEVFRFMDLWRTGHAKECDAFQEFITNRGTGLRPGELAAFNDSLEQLS